MKQKDFLSKIDYAIYDYESKIQDNAFTGIEDIGHFTFNNVFYYSRNENEKISVVELVEEIVSKNIPRRRYEIFKLVPELETKIDEILFDGTYNNFEQLLKRALFEYQKDFVLENIEHLFRLHFLNLAKEIVKNSEREEIKVNWEWFNDLVIKKAKEFCSKDVLYKYVPTEFNEFKEILVQ
ncbi:hypothetical protein [Mycoplasma phage sp.]|nr:hypothetical protein [Mycoplasma phage sp.]